MAVLYYLPTIGSLQKNQVLCYTYKVKTKNVHGHYT